MLRFLEFVEPTMTRPFFHSSFLNATLPEGMEDEPSDE
jgi:hypothetical protein